MQRRPIDSDDFDVGELSELPDGEPVSRQVERRRIALIRLGTTVHAVRDTCPHQGARLSDGRVMATCRLTHVGNRWEQTDLTAIQCPWHGWAFGLEDGKALFDPTRARVRRYATRVEGGRVHVRLNL